MIAANVLMLVGALTWLAGELYGVFRKGKGNDTTTDWVRSVEAMHFVGPFARVLVGTFVISLFFHFLYGTYLLP